MAEPKKAPLPVRPKPYGPDESPNLGGRNLTSPRYPTGTAKGGKAYGNARADPTRASGTEYRRFGPTGKPVRVPTPKAGYRTYEDGSQVKVGGTKPVRKAATPARPISKPKAK